MRVASVTALSPAATATRMSPRPTGAGLPLAAGIGLKPSHFTDLLDGCVDVDFLEVHAENYLVAGGPLHHFLTRVREKWPLSIHGVGLSIGAEDGLDPLHLKRICELVNRYEPAEFSEHLAWSSHGGRFLNDLLPLPYDQATLDRVCAHVDLVQEAMRRTILLENPSSYVEFAESTFSEDDFLGEVVRRTGCGLLLDVNNVYVSATNHGRDAREYIAALPRAAVRQIHLAGFHRDEDSLGYPLLIDTHGAPVDHAVWELYGWALSHVGSRPTLIEWDNDVPSVDRLQQEAHTAREMIRRAVATSTVRS